MENNYSDYTELILMFTLVVLFILSLVYNIFVFLTISQIIILIFLAVLFNIGAVFLTKIMVKGGNIIEGNFVRKNNISKRLTYFIGALAILIISVIVYMFMPLMIGNFGIFICGYTGIDFIHDVRMYISDTHPSV